MSFPPSTLSTAPPAPAPRPQRPRWPGPVAVGVVALALGAAWWTGVLPTPEVGTVLPGAPLGSTNEDPPSAVVPEEPAPEPPAPELPPPPAHLVALADEAFLSPQGRDLFFGAQPEVLGAAEFAGRCDRPTPRIVRTDVVGCFTGGTIVVYEPTDPRLRGFVVETAAHETLHAAWETLAAPERDTLTALLETEIARQPADARILEQIAGSVGDAPQNRATELFAYIGTQVWRDGGLAPELEAVYDRFITDRAALVAVHTGWRGLVEGMLAEIEAAQRAYSDRQLAVAQQRAQLDADSASVDFYRQAYQQRAAEVAGLPADDQQRLRLSWVWWDGTDLPMAPAGETLARAAELLARDDAALASRGTAVAAEEAAVAAERSRIEALIADYDGLTAQLSPSA